MAKDNNLKDYLTDLYEGIKTKKSNASRNPQDFRTEIESISTGIEGVTETDTKVYVNTEKNVEIGEKPKKISIYNQDYTITNYGQNATLINWGSIIGENFLEENIKKGVNIFGKTGTYESDGIEGVTEKNETIYIGENSNNTRLYLENTNKLINDVGIGKDQVNVSLYSHDSKVYCYGNNTQIAMMGTNKAVATNLSPGNIKKDINILGHVGTLEAVEGVTEDEEGVIEIQGNTSSNSVSVYDNKNVTVQGTGNNVTLYNDKKLTIYGGDVEIKGIYGGSISGENFLEENIKKGVNIFGKTGTFEGGITIPSVTNITLNGTMLSWVAPNYEELEVSKTSYLVSVNSAELETEETSLNVADYLIDGNNTISVIVKATLSREGESATEIVEYSKPQLLDVITKMNATLTTSLGYSSAVVINDKAYLFIKGNPQFYDPSNDTITTLGASIKYTGTSAVNINNKAYIFGGNLNGTRKNPIECYDPTSDTITTMSATLVINADNTSAVNINNKAYIFGGGTGGSQYIQCYDPTSDTITTMSATLVIPLTSTSAVTINNKAYIFGGVSNGTRENTIQCYDPSNDTITTMGATLTIPLLYTSAVNINNKAYIFGGYNGSSYNTIQCYDPSNDTITTMSATLVAATDGTCAVTINNKAYIFGGNDKNTIQRYE